MADHLSIETLQKALKTLGWKKLRVISSLRLAIITDKNRKEVLERIATSFRNFNARYDPRAKGSSVGAVFLEGLTVFAKPIQISIFAKPATRGLPGSDNEFALVDSINKLTKDIGGSIDVEFKSASQPGKRFKISNVSYAVHFGLTAASKPGIKADVVLKTETGKEIPISLKKDDAEYWGTGDKYSALAKEWILKLLKEKKIELLKEGKYFRVKPNFAFRANENIKKSVIFGDDILGKGAVVTKTFEKDDFNYSGESNTLYINCSSIIKDLSDVPIEYTPWMLLRQDKSRNNANLFPGLRVYVVYQKRLGSTILRAN